MAKVGNEAKLILRLAEERVAGRVRAMESQKPDASYSNGFRSGVTIYKQTLDEVVSELEGK